MNDNTWDVWTKDADGTHCHAEALPRAEAEDLGWQLVAEGYGEYREVLLVMHGHKPAGLL